MVNTEVTRLGNVPRVGSQPRHATADVARTAATFFGPGSRDEGNHDQQGGSDEVFAKETHCADSAPVSEGWLLPLSSNVDAGFLAESRGRRQLISHSGTYGRISSLGQRAT